MLIQHMKHPFHHTIIYDYFDNEYQSVYDEFESIFKGPYQSFPDDHHSQLVNNHKTDTFDLDSLYEGRRDTSSILRSMRKIFHINKMQLLTDNPFCGYIDHSNKDTTMINRYKNGSSYFKHRDTSVLTFLYTLWKEPKQWSGDLIFNDYAYRPYLRNNCCLIFPGHEVHEVEKVSGEGIRYTINQRIYIEAK